MMDERNKFKYQEVASSLSNAINAGDFDGKLPGVRALGEMFGVNNRTVLRALQELTARGLVSPNRNLGYIIHQADEVRPVTGNIVIFIPRHTIEGEPGEKPGTLERLAAAAGKRLITITSTDSTLLAQREFWQTLCADGVLFINSTLEEAAAFQLKLSGIPFVAANRMPAEWGVNCVDFDHEKSLHELFSLLISGGHRRIGMICDRWPLAYFREIIFDCYEKCMRRFSIFDPDLFRYPAAGAAAGECAAEAVERMLALPRPPTAIYTTLDPHLVEGLLHERRGSLPHKISVFSHFSSGVTPRKAEFPGIEYPHRELLETLWQQMEKVIKHPGDEPETVLVSGKIIGSSESFNLQK